MKVLFALGSNGSGQLGIGHKEDVSVPKQVLLPEELDQPTIKKVAAGGNHTLLLTEDGELFWSGDAATGACGKVTPEQLASQPQFHRVDFSALNVPFRVGLVAATWEATVITRLNAEGQNTEVYSFGVGMKGELGQGELIIRTPAPSLIRDFPPPGTEIIDLVACMGHVLAVLNSGEVYGWGNGRKGQLGSAEGVVHAPRKIEGVGFKVVRAACGREFTCLFGDSESGEIMVLGSDKWDVRSNAPSTAAGWKDIGASWGNVYVLKKDGKLLGWGRNDHGQLVPEHLPHAIGMAIGSEHALAQTEDGDVLAWGWGEHGNCGPTNLSEDTKQKGNIVASTKYIPQGSKITSIGAGCATSWVSIDLPS
ncbi:RCC1/BLIP-II [Thozetella sp. PMI_491]|nr:RCC1/BLIP-II [Thozetella sp. PMI_491]